MTIIKRYLFVAAAAVALMACTAHAQTVTIDLSAEKQVIRGFGGMNHPSWMSSGDGHGDLTASERQTAFGNGPNELGFTVLRIPIDENSNGWSRELATAKYASDRGVLVFASPWNPPSSMTITGQSTYNSSNQYANTKKINPNSFPQYVNHLNSFIKYMTDNGVDLYAVSVQNEHDYGYHGDGGAWTEWPRADIINFLKNHAAGINARVMSPEPFQYAKGELSAILNDADALANTDIFATHTYGTRVVDFPFPLFKEKGAGKELWMTEVYVPNSEGNSADRWPEALEVAVHMHRAMVDAEFQAYVWWYIRRSYGPMLENGTISKRGWMMAHFSKFVRPGYVRVGATPAVPVAETINPSTWGDHGKGGAFVSAYRSGNRFNDSVVIVAVNRANSTANLTFNIHGREYPTGSNAASTVTVEGWRTTGDQNMVKLETTEEQPDRFSVSLPAQSVTTYIVPPLAYSSITDVITKRNMASPISVKGRMLNVSQPNNSELKIRVIDVKGKVRANFTVSGNAKFSMTKIPAGRYFVEVHGAGVNQTLPIILK